MANSLLQNMGAQNAWGLSDSQRVRTPKVTQRVSLVTPRMDVDVTGVAFKNLRTHLIDHPRDEGLKHREQLWNFQQKYRGAVGKPRGNNSTMSRSSSAMDYNKAEGDRKGLKSVKSEPTLSLHARFKRRYFNKFNMAAVRGNDVGSESNMKRMPNEQSDIDKKHPGIQRLYSSGMIVRNTIYNQIRGTEEPDEKRSDSADNSRIAEAVEKFGALEKLPEISYSQPPLTSRLMKTLNHYGRRYGESTGRIMQLRRSLTNISDSSICSRQKRLLIVSRREVSVHMDCINSDNDDGDQDEEVEDENDDDDDDDDDDDEDIDEYSGNDEALRAQRLCSQDLDQKRGSLFSIRSNVTQVNCEEDLEQIENHNSEHTSQKGENKIKDGSSGHVHVSVNNHNSKPLNSSGNDEQDALQVSSIVFETKSESDRTKDSERLRRPISKQCKTDKKENKDDRPSSTDSLDIPKERFGCTTHSIDRKLAIRKPWEWRPSPYRWTDKSVKESDKPYIERILNKGEVIDEYTYDAFARTKPLKLSNYPDPPYKDRSGVLR